MSERYPFHFVPSCAECGAKGAHPTTVEPHPKPEKIECLECRRIVERHLTEMENSIDEIDETIHENWLKQGGPGS